MLLGDEEEEEGEKGKSEGVEGLGIKDALGRGASVETAALSGFGSEDEDGAEEEEDDEDEDEEEQRQRQRRWMGPKAAAAPGGVGSCLPPLKLLLRRPARALQAPAANYVHRQLSPEELKPYLLQHGARSMAYGHLHRAQKHFEVRTENRQTPVTGSRGPVKSRAAATCMCPSPHAPQHQSAELKRLPRVYPPTNPLKTDIPTPPNPGARPRRRLLLLGPLPRGPRRLRRRRPPGQPRRDARPAPTLPRNGARDEALLHRVGACETRFGAHGLGRHGLRQRLLRCVHQLLLHVFFFILSIRSSQSHPIILDRSAEDGKCTHAYVGEHAAAFAFLD